MHIYIYVFIVFIHHSNVFNIIPWDIGTTKVFLNVFIWTLKLKLIF